MAPLVESIYQMDMAFIGQYAVLPEYQGKGIGSALWKAMMTHIGTERNVSLYAAKEMIPKYRDRSNFIVIPKKCGLWFSGKFNSNQLIEAIDGISVLPISEDNIEKVVQYQGSARGGIAKIPPPEIENFQNTPP